VKSKPIKQSKKRTQSVGRSTSRAKKVKTHQRMGQINQKTPDTRKAWATAKTEEMVKTTHVGKKLIHRAKGGEKKGGQQTVETLISPVNRKRM